MKTKTKQTPKTLISLIKRLQRDITSISNILDDARPKGVGLIEWQFGGGKQALLRKVLDQAGIQ